ncbi:MAG TPA: adenylate kinase family protein [Methanoregulaceae archaeon]|nr:adenylate kinase family protein [Methanoregulaceae archaeon]HPD76458.1 adenylate kinase family protein [Methanoregulaceae archaeon]HRY75058.1 adenylate kinase family protein [Methanoregulaceae archaeon]
MMCGITGTPGTGKSAVGEELARRGHAVVHVTDTVQDYVIGMDNERDSRIIDTKRWIEEFLPVDGFVEGHLAHLLPCDKIVVLRCRPDELQARLLSRGYSMGKVDENVEAEAIDVCLIETVERYDPSQILELDTTRRSVADCAEQAEGFATGKIPASFGGIDWSGFLEVVR